MLHIAPSALPANAPGAVAAHPASLSLNAYGTASAAPTVPVQLPTAIMASGAVAAYHPNTQQSAKPAVRLASSSQLSSQLTAQYLAQTPDVSHGDGAVFTPVVRTPVSMPPDESLSYLNDLRMANGELPPAPPEAGQSASASGAPNAPNISTASEPSANRAVASAQPSGVGGQMATANNAAQVMVEALALKLAPPIQARPAPAPLVPVGKKPNIGQARYAYAYQLAESRNATIRFSTSVAAIS